MLCAAQDVIRDARTADRVSSGRGRADAREHGCIVLLTGRDGRPVLLVLPAHPAKRRGVHGRLTDLMARYNVNDYAAIVEGIPTV